MNQQPYSVFVRPRPVRTVFLIDTSVFVPGTERFDALVDALIRHNCLLWGGRTNPIIFFSGESLEPDVWKQLEIVDVDCLKSFSPLSQNLVKQLDERLQPWSIEEIKQHNPGHPSVESYGVTCPPTPENLRGFRENIFDSRKTKLLMFDFAPNCEPAIQRFIHRNFGTFEQWFENGTKVRRIMLLERLMAKIDVEHIPISDKDSLIQALTLLAGTPPGRGYQAPLKFVAPCQLPSIHLPEMWPHMANAYHVIVGNDPDTLTEFWNGTFWKRAWTVPYSYQLWIPTELARDPLLHDAFRNWLRLYSGTGNSNAKHIEFLSSTLSGTELDALQRSICNGGPWAPRGSVPQPDILLSRKHQAEKEIPVVLRNRGWSNADESVRFTGNSPEETFTLNKPDSLAEEINTSSVWMIDVHIEHVSSELPTMREQSWWAVPRLNSGGLLAGMFKGGARVNRLGSFSVRVANESGIYARGAKPELKIQLPDETTVVPALITRPSNQCLFTSDLRYNEQRFQSKISHVRYSDKGKYLAGLIQIFGNFWTAKEFCDRRFWRHMFTKLANNDARKDEKLQQDITNMLKKRIPAHDSHGRLAERALGLVRGRSKPGIALPYSAFKTELDELAKMAPPSSLNYPQGDTIVSHHGITNLTEEEMNRGLDNLVELNVLRLGAYSRCRLCGIETWYHVDELKQSVRCPGCGRDQSIGAQHEWHYALNSLVETGVKQGQLSVMHAFAALASRSHGAFFH